MATVSDFRNGMALRHEGAIWIIQEFIHVTPGNWRAMMRTRLKNLQTGRVNDVTFRMSDKIEEVRLESKKMQFLYAEDDLLHFMDPDTFEQTYISADLLGDSRGFLKEQEFCTVLFLEGKAVTAELPFSVELEVTDAEPGVRGDTATNVTQAATLETGAKVQVPIFIKVGDRLKIDTRTGKYSERVSNK